MQVLFKMVQNKQKGGTGVENLPPRSGGVSSRVKFYLKTGDAGVFTDLVIRLTLFIFKAPNYTFFILLWHRFDSRQELNQTMEEHLVPCQNPQLH